MANQAVKFHSVTEEQYEGIDSPSAGSLYFISDNGEIRKGDKHITGTRVYTAESSTGSEAIDDLIVTDAYGETSKVQKKDKDKNPLFYGTDGEETTDESHQKTDDDGNLVYLDADGKETTSAKTDDADNTKVMIANEKVMIANDSYDNPKRGDMLVVTHTLATGKDEQTAYIYKTNGGTYASSGWQACDGNVDASKVILTQDITLAGNYTSIGNFSKGSAAGSSKTYLNGGSTSGVSVFELIKQMLSQTIEPTWQKNPPTGSLNTPNAGSVEYGATASATWTATLNDAYAKYTGGSNQYAGCSATSYKFDGATTGTTTKTLTKTWIAGSESAPSASVIIDYSASKNTIKNNVGDDATITPSSIAAGSTASTSTTATITPFRYTFWQAFSFDDKIDVSGTVLSKGVDEDGNPIEVTSADVRDGSTFYWNTKQAALPTSISFTGKTQILVIAPSSTFGSKKVTATTSKGLPAAESKAASGITITVKGAGDDDGVAYSVWVIDMGSDCDDTLTLAWA